MCESVGEWGAYRSHELSLSVDFFLLNIISSDSSLGDETRIPLKNGKSKSFTHTFVEVAD